MGITILYVSLFGTMFILFVYQNHMRYPKKEHAQGSRRNEGSSHGLGSVEG